MKTLKDYIVESETWMQTPAEGDTFGIELSDGTLIESYILELADDSILLDATADIVSVLESWNLLSAQESEDGVILETIDLGEGRGGNYEQMNYRKSTTDKFVLLDRFLDAVILTTNSFQEAKKEAIEWAEYDDIKTEVIDQTTGKSIFFVDGYAGAEKYMDEAKYHGREVPLGKPMKGDVKKSKVYVRDPSTGNIKKVNFGDPNMRIKKTSPARRKSFRARHNCANPGSRLKARYWSCRAW
jgi:hypothetical protein